MNLLSSVLVQKPVSQSSETRLLGKGRRSSGLNVSPLVQKEDSENEVSKQELILGHFA